MQQMEQQDVDRMICCKWPWWLKKDVDSDKAQVFQEAKTWAFLFLCFKKLHHIE